MILRREIKMPSFNSTEEGFRVSPCVRNRFVFARRFVGNQPDRISRNEKRKALMINATSITEIRRRQTAQRRADCHQQKARRKHQSRSRKQALPCRSIFGVAAFFAPSKNAPHSRKQNRRQISNPEIFRARHQQKHQRDDNAHQIRPNHHLPPRKTVNKSSRNRRKKRKRQAVRQTNKMPAAAGEASETRRTKPKPAIKLNQFPSSETNCPQKQIAEIAVAF